jgi:cell division protein FtsQ
VLAGIALLILGVGAYLGARETSVFAVREVDVVGGSPALQAHLRSELETELGKSLVQIDGDEIVRRVAANAGVLSVGYDRVFPHTLRVLVTPERPVLLLRRGSEGWVVSARGRVVRRVEDVASSSLPRTYIPKETAFRLGEVLPPANGGLAATALAPVGASTLPEHVRVVRASESELTFVLRSGLEVRMGDPGDLRLKLAVAAQILALLGSDPVEAYVDVSVPERPVVGTQNPQVASTG